jgi:hypothetical protein
MLTRKFFEDGVQVVVGQAANFVPTVAVARLPSKS